MQSRFITAKDKRGSTVLHYAAENRELEVVQWLKQDGHSEIVKSLTEEKADVNAQNQHGHTALILAAQSGHVEIVKSLIEAKADVNAQNEDGDTSLILAAWHGHGKIFKSLIEAKADVNTQNRYGDTALTLAARNGHEEITKLLVEAKVDVNAQNQYGNTALTLAACMDTVKLSSRWWKQKRMYSRHHIRWLGRKFTYKMAIFTDAQNNQKKLFRLRSLKGHRV
jgi:ankyrin repeat protein